MNRLNLCVISLLMLLNLFLIYKVFISENGIRKVIRFKNSIERIEEQIYEYKKDNMKLIKKIRTIKRDSDFLKRLIKKKMIFAEQDEIIYLTKEKKKN